MRSSHLLGALALSVGHHSLAAHGVTVLGPVSDMVIKNKVIAPDGFSRSAVLAGDTFPGPVIVAQKGQDFSINVINQLKDNTMLRSTSIHWHGFLQHGTNWADGGAFVNQCPIAANNSFVYNFKSTDQAGTFWYHSHLSSQYCDGLRGPMVVYDPNDPHRALYDIDNPDTVITLADWYHLPAPSAGEIPYQNSALINGLGRYQGGPASPLAVITVMQGKRYRFRLINISCDPNYIFTIDGHEMTVIEADGVTTQARLVDSIQIYAGQRYSFVLKATKPIGNYWIRTVPDVGAIGHDNKMNLAILRYMGAPMTDPTTTKTTSVMPLKETDLPPLENPGAPGIPEPGKADVSINLAIDVAFNPLRFLVNGVAYHSPTMPVLLQILSGAQQASALMPAGAMYELPRNKVIELSMPGGAPGSPHPIHLHGHVFDVIRSAGSSTYNFVNPSRRDVVSTGFTGDNVTIRFVTDNAGPWFLHCHIDWHLEVGFAVVFAEDMPGTQAAHSGTAQWDQLCPIYDSLTPDQL